MVVVIDILDDSPKPEIPTPVLVQEVPPQIPEIPLKSQEDVEPVQEEQKEVPMTIQELLQEPVKHEYDPTDDELPEEAYLTMDSANKSLTERTIEGLKKIDAFNIDTNLNTDVKQILGQKYALVIYCGPEQRAKYDKNMIYILGVFDGPESIQAFLSQRNKNLVNYDVYTVTLYEWLASYPIANETVKERDVFLHETIFHYKKAFVEQKIKYDARRLALRSNKHKKIATENTAPAEHVNKLFEKEKNEKEKEREQELIKSKEKENNIFSKPFESNTNTNTFGLIKMEKYDLSQNFAVLCIVGITNSNKRTAIKIKGVFDTYEQAKEYAKVLTDLEPIFDFVICEIGGWLETDRDLSDVSQVYKEEIVSKFVNPIIDSKIEQVHTEHAEFEKEKSMQ